MARVWSKVNRKIGPVWAGFLTFALTAFLLVLPGRLVYLHTCDLIRESMENELHSRAMEASDLVDPDAYRKALEDHGNHPMVLRPIEKQFEQMLARFSSIRSISTYFVDEGAVRYGICSPGMSEGRRFGDLVFAPSDGLKLALNSADPAMETTPRGPADQRVVQAFMPIYDAQGKFIGVVGVNLDYEMYGSRFESARVMLVVWIACALFVSAYSAWMTFSSIKRLGSTVARLIEAKNRLELKNLELAEVNMALDREVRLDPLTGLLNRRSFENLVKDATRRYSEGRSQGVCVMFMDVDNFKLVNDTYGHEEGDRLLMALSDMVRKVIPEATVARFGGDELVALKEGRFAEDYLAAGAKSLLAELTPSMGGTTARYAVKASIGIASQHSKSETGSEVIRKADIAMYRAKSEGKNRFMVFEEAMSAEVVKRVEMEEKLRVALAKSEFSMYIQPIFELETLQVVGGELLLRWTTADGQSIGPADFVPVAEETGLIKEIGVWVLRQGFEQLVRWKESWVTQGYRVSVNVSNVQVAMPEFVDVVASLLDEFDVDPSLLTIEVTESVMSSTHQASCDKLAAIRALGIKVAMDDFGTGYSSLSMLTVMPLDCLKIDKSFVMNINESSRSENLARTLLALGQTMGLSVVSEGIETEAHLETLLKMGCKYGQGYAFSKPIPLDDFEARYGAGSVEDEGKAA